MNEPLFSPQRTTMWRRSWPRQAEINNSIIQSQRLNDRTGLKVGCPGLMIPPTWFAPPPNFINMEKYGELVQYIPRAASKKEHQNFKALDKVSHDITGNPWKLRAIVFFFFLDG